MARRVARSAVRVSMALFRRKKRVGSDGALVRQRGLDLGLSLAAIAVLYVVFQVFYWRIDLTADGRYTLGEYTRASLTELEEPVYVTVYLDGALPLEFRRLRQGVDELLEELRIRSGFRFRVRYEDPNDPEMSARAASEYRQRLLREGVPAIGVQERAADGTLTERMVYPGFSMTYGGATRYQGIYVDDAMRPVEQNIHSALEGLEFRFVSTLHQLMRSEEPRIGVLQSHGTLPPLEMAHWLDVLSLNYRVEFLEGLRGPGLVDSLDMLVIAGPDSAFSEPEKLVLDQYVVQGGRLLLMLSPIRYAADSLETSGSTLIYPRDVNLDDLLFSWGLRLGPHVIMDRECAVVPVNRAVGGQPARFTPMPWYYYPLLLPNTEEYLTRDVRRVYSRFPSAIELLPGVKTKRQLRRRVLLSSSAYARVVTGPAMVSMDEIRIPPERLGLAGGPFPVVVALEGAWESLFVNRPVGMLAGEHRAEGWSFREAGDSVRLVVAAYGDLARNDVTHRKGQPQPMRLGFDRYTQQTFGNKEFLDNVVLYLLDEEALLSLRGRELEVRLMDVPRIYANRGLWVSLALVVPLVLLACIGGGVALWRRLYHRRLLGGGER